MKFIPALIALSGIVVVAGCTGMKIAAERAAEYDFSRVATYQWVDAPAAILEADDTYLNTDLQTALNNELGARGWKQVLESTNATIQVAYHIKIDAHEEYTSLADEEERNFSGGITYQYHTREWKYEERDPDQNAYTIEIGTLSVTMTDVSTGDRVWLGTLETKIDRSMPIEKQKALFQRVARKLMERLPAGTK